MGIDRDFDNLSDKDKSMTAKELGAWLETHNVQLRIRFIHGEFYVWLFDCTLPAESFLPDLEWKDSDLDVALSYAMDCWENKL